MAALVAGCAPATVERNRRAEVDESEAPALVVYDLGHSAVQTDYGDTSYVMQIEVEGTVASTEAMLGTSVNALYVRSILALGLTTDPTLGGLCVDLRETGLDVRVLPTSEAAKPIANFTLSLEVEFHTPDGDPTG